MALILQPPNCGPWKGRPGNFFPHPYQTVHKAIQAPHATRLPLKCSFETPSLLTHQHMIRFFLTPIASLLLLAFLTLTACSRENVTNTENLLAGTWVHTMTEIDMPDDDLDQVITERDYRIIMSEDGTYVMENTDGNSLETYLTGEWTLSGESITFQHLTISLDGSEPEAYLYTQEMELVEVSDSKLILQIRIADPMSSEEMTVTEHFARN